MFNVLLDHLPQEWNGYPIDTDFQTGILINQCLGDATLSERERFYTAAGLLFTEKWPETNREVADAINWYMTEYNHDNKVEGDKPDIMVMDWDIDQWRIYAAFRQQYQVDLNKEEMHWFVFMGLLSNLEECAFTHVMEIRQRKISPKMSPEAKAALKRAKKVFAIEEPKGELSAEEQRRVDEFLKYANIKREPKRAGEPVI